MADSTHPVFDPNTSREPIDPPPATEVRLNSASGADMAAKKPARPIDDNVFDEIDQEDGIQHETEEMKKPKSKFQRYFEYLLPPGGTVSSAFTLGSATLGAGILGLPYAFNSMGLITSLLILIVVVFLTIFSLWLMAKAADYSGMRTYADIAHVILGRWPSVAITFFLIVFCLGTDVSYIISIGDLLTPMFDSPDIPAFLRTKSGNRLIVSMIWLVGIFPLCLLRSIDSLRHVSTLAVLMVCFFVICIIIDCGKYWKRHGWNEEVNFFNTGNSAIVGLGTLLFACLVQMNAFEIYHQLRKPTPFIMARNSALGMGVCGILYCGSGIFGYSRFGPKVTSSILLMYQPRDEPIFWASYIGMLLKLAVGFALHQIPIRDCFYHYMHWDVYKMTWLFNALWCAIFSTIVLIMGLFIPSINIVLGLVGSLCGGFVGLIYPPIMVMYCGHWSFRRVGFLQYFATYLLMIVGVVAVCFGTIASIYDVI